ncbi:unnamed protein product [Caenorhabditis nigoni]|uniref:PLAT domain-containing protein n=1 Tax=Caenorhabditis nigoni TaxID=1611254 RepID=A0A2G5VR96_9PELO|nr:hypothetical protein B9Z55_003611 [Caenorhabditis nigoni]
MTEPLKEMGSSVRSKYDEDDTPASFTILIRTSSNSCPDGPVEKISVMIRDDEGRATDKQALRYSHTHPTPFQRGHTDMFVMTNQPSLGPLTNFEIHYDGQKEPLGTPWKFHTVVIFHHENGRVYNFQIDEKQSSESVSVLICKDDGVQAMPIKLRDPFF